MARWHGLARAFSLVLALVATTCGMATPSRAQTSAGHPLTATTSAAPAEGSFVSTPDGRVYRIAGGAPLYISSWAAVGGPQPVTPISAAQLAALRSVPADGTLINTPTDGRVYVVAGGAPVYVPSWDQIGGARSSIAVDQWAVDHPEDPHAHLNARPADGTTISTPTDGRVYVIAGGAPIYVPSWDQIGGPRPATAIPQWAVDHPEDPHAHLNAVPLNGTFLRDVVGRVFRVVGGAALPITDCSVLAGCPASVLVAPGGFARSLRAIPVSGSVLYALPSGQWWLIQDGARRPTGSSSAAVAVDDAAAGTIPLLGSPTSPATTVTGSGRTNGRAPRAGRGLRTNSARVVYAFKRVNASASTPSWTMFTALTVSRIPAHAAVRASCTGGGCPRRTVVRTGRRTVKLTPLLHRRLAPGATIRIAVSGTKLATKTVTLIVRRNANPKLK
jgi:hypothetical protein